MTVILYFAPILVCIYATLGDKKINGDKMRMKNNDSLFFSYLVHVAHTYTHIKLIYVIIDTRMESFIAAIGVPPQFAYKFWGRFFFTLFYCLIVCEVFLDAKAKFVRFFLENCLSSHV